VAPGFMIGNVIVMAGVPAVMQVMLDAVTPRLEKGRQMHSAAIDLTVPEGEIAEMLGEHQKQYPGVAMGSYPTWRSGRPATQLVLRSTDEPTWREAVEGLKAKLFQRGLI
ncbi:MAG: competence/damage-inducible protein A, partial [Hyphomicrobium sp.]